MVLPTPSLSLPGPRFYLHLETYPQKVDCGTSLVVQWLRICLPMQGTWIQSLVWEDSTYLGETKPQCRNDRSMPASTRAHVLHLEKPLSEKPARHSW